MKWILTFLFFVGFNVIQAQEPVVEELSKSVSLTTTADLNFLIETHKKKNQKTDEMNGYRIQIVYNTDREEVYNMKSKVYQQFTEFKSYIVYDQPYYKLRMGDFKTRMEARKYLEEVLEFFPTSFIVKDVIKIK